MPPNFKVTAKKSIIIPFVYVVLSGSMALLSGCATVGANLSLDAAKNEEAKGCAASFPGDIPQAVKLEDCERISRIIKKAGVTEGFVGYDKSGRIKLKGAYKNEEQLDKAYMVALTVVGANSMEISPITPRDLQEIKLVKSYTPQKASNKRGEKYALLIGVSKFKGGISPIATAIQDVESLQAALERNGFKNKNIVTLTDEAATKANILDAMQKLESQVTQNDYVVIYISTHGTPPDTYGKMGIIPYDMKSEITNEKLQAIVDKINKDESGDDEVIKIVNQRISSLKTAISFTDLQNFITSIKTEKFVAIIDTCFSGAALGALSYPVGGTQYSEREKNYSQSQSNENKSALLGGNQTQACKLSDYPESVTKTFTIAFSENNSGTKGMYNAEEKTNVRKTQAKNHTDSDLKFERFEELKSAFSVTSNTSQKGKIIITATNGSEQSLFDKERLPNSFFTYYFVDGLNRFNGQVFKSFDYAKVRTSNLVNRDYSPKQQTPEMLGVPSQCINIDLSK